VTFPLRMLTDMIVEEDFEKDEESWYGRQDLEHGKDSWERSRPSAACYIVITVWTYSNTTSELCRFNLSKSIRMSTIYPSNGWSIATLV